MRETVPAGTVLEGTYRITRFIGEGGMGAVYEAQHGRLAGRYAVKFLHPEIHQHPEALARFRREAQITSALRHPGIVQVIDFNTPAKGPPFLVMEYLEGSDLGDVIAREAPFPLGRVVEITSQLASALAAAHRRGIVHRDLNPNNVFLVPADGDQPERVKVLDFGVSKIRSVSKRITGTAQVLGTPQYMAPEQAEGRGADVDEAADQFSVAVMIYEMLTGQAPFAGANLPSVVYQIVHATPTPLSQLRPDLPPDVEAVVSRGLAKNKRQRFESISDLASALRRAAGLGPPPGAAFKHRTRAPETSARWDEAGTVISPPGFVERLAAEHAARERRDTGTGSRPTINVQPPERTTTLGRQTGELTPPQAPEPARRPLWPYFTMSVAVAGLVFALSWTSHRRHASASRVSAFQPRPPAGPTVLPLPAADPPAEAEPLQPVALAQPKAHKAPEKPQEKPHDKPQERAQAKPQEKPQEKPRAKPEAPSKTAAAPAEVADEAPAARAAPEAADEAQKMEGELGLAAIHTAPEPASCTLTVGSSPWAELWVDGRDTGHQTPVVHLEVDCGRHTLSFKRDDLDIDHDVDVKLTAGAEFKARYKLGADE